MSCKREDYISWDEYFMGVAMLSARRSKDPNTQVGCLSLIHISNKNTYSIISINKNKKYVKKINKNTCKEDGYSI